MLENLIILKYYTSDLLKIINILYHTSAGDIYTPLMNIIIPQ
jgi:hypothetical protein